MAKFIFAQICPNSHKLLQQIILTYLYYFFFFQALQKAGQIISEIRETHVW